MNWILRHIVRWYIMANMSHEKSYNRGFILKAIGDSFAEEFPEDNAKARQITLANWMCLEDAEYLEVIKQENKRHFTKPIVKNAVQCRICGAPADRYGGAEQMNGFDRSTWGTMFICQANPNHVGDCIVGIFSDLTPPIDCDTVRL